ncbi:MAG: cob(I)yrinic acid a,c-diamide adenosyltransferase [Ardenticatenaceae bacterium]|nr:cob(I)yrinic acid a,c-diamide adenosyltransferase [Ardenticatenaceae bacterium]
MPRITKIYTRKGDDGTTSLGSRERVSKDALRVQAYGVVDELNSVIGVALASGLSARLAELLPIIQNELFNLGSDLAFYAADKEKYGIPQILPSHVDQLELWIDEMSEVVGPLENFILPGGVMGAAYLHMARTVCRRAERDAISLAHVEPNELNPNVIKYLNRLSDVLFVMARYENHQKGMAEPLWNTSA